MGPDWKRWILYPLTGEEGESDDISQIFCNRGIDAAPGRLRRDDPDGAKCSGWRRVGRRTGGCHRCGDRRQSRSGSSHRRRRRSRWGRDQGFVGKERRVLLSLRPSPLLIPFPFVWKSEPRRRKGMTPQGGPMPFPLRGRPLFPDGKEKTLWRPARSSSPERTPASILADSMGIPGLEYSTGHDALPNDPVTRSACSSFRLFLVSGGNLIYTYTLDMPTLAFLTGGRKGSVKVRDRYPAGGGRGPFHLRRSRPPATLL